MLLTILSMLGGGLMRLMPEVMSWMNKKSDYGHELAMMDKQFSLEQFRATAKMAEIKYQGEIDMTLAGLAAQKEALAGQMQKTGMKIVDALNFLVRPLTTYYFLLLYGAAKLAMFVLMLNAGVGGWEAIVKIYDADDRAILSGIISFWFVGRIFDKAK
jgi:hypothetical protein